LNLALTRPCFEPIIAWMAMNRAHFHVSRKARSGTFPGAKGIRARPLNRGNRPVTPDPEKLPAKLPASREFGF
jgi:hypothetical protein